MRYLSVCSGIEAATQAWHPLGWKPVAFSEIEKFPSAVLAHHYPDVPNWGDMTKYEEWPDEPIDLLCGGTPCQSFSVAGLRKGLADPRGNLMLTYLAIAARYRPRWLVWENVPGVLSSNGGRDFGTFLGMLGELGYGVAYRVLDAQHVRTRRFPFAVPQRRRRVWVVGYLGDWRRSAAVLFDRESLSGRPAPRRETGEGVAGSAVQGVALRGREGGATAELTGEVSPALRCAGVGGDKAHVLTFDRQSSGEYGEAPVASTMSARDFKGAADLVAHTLNGEGFDASEDGTGRQNLIPVAFAPQAGGKQTSLGASVDDSCQTLSSTQTPAIVSPWAVRRLTPRECERLQGFPQLSESVIFSAWLGDKSQLSADAAIQCITGQSNALIAGESAQQRSAKIAAPASSTSRADRVPPVALHVQIDLERDLLQFHKAGRLIWSANIADQSSGFPLPMPIGDFVRIVALTTQTAAKLTPDGKVASRTTERLSSHLWSGRSFVGLSGREIAEHAAVVERFTSAGWKPSMLTTSPSIANIPTSVSTLTTLCCCVLNAIASCIPETISSGNSYSLSIETVSGFTAIPWRGKPADQCPDGPRYKALGNSWAVNCAEWIGERIAHVDAI